jgi:hypothetical protein
MYQEDIARETTRHLREHIKDYLDDIWAQYTGELTVPLVVPKRIDISSSVGGMINEFDQILPQYGIDILGKAFSPTDESLWSYEYPGQINGLVHGGSRESVDLLIGRHARAVEFFIRQHKLLHEFKTNNFSLLELAFAGVDFSGAEEMVDSESGGTTWLAGFSINASWFLSEDGPDDHGS